MNALATPARSAREELAFLGALAWPVVLGQVGLIAMSVVDLLVVGRLGEQATAVVGLGHTWGFAALAFGIGVSAGVDPLVSHAYGAGRPDDAVRALLRGAVLLAALCVPMAAAHWWAAPALEALGQPAAVVRDTGRYCQILAPSVVPFFVFQLLRQFLQGSGRMRAATTVILVGNLLNGVAAWVLVHGVGRWDGLGWIGSAWATAVVRWAMALALALAAAPTIRDAWPGLRAALQPRAVGMVAAISLPVGFQIALEVWAFNAASLMAGWIDRTAMAAHTVALSLASTSFMVPLGISAAASTRVGNLVGAGAPWQRSGWTALTAGATVMLASALLYASFPVALARAYNEDPQVIAAAAAVLPIAALFQVFDGTQGVGFGVLRGLGDTRLPAAFNLVGYGLIGLPTGYWLAFHRGWGLAGVWGGLTVGLATVAALLVARIAVHARRTPGG